MEEVKRPAKYEDPESDGRSPAQEMEDLRVQLARADQRARDLAEANESLHSQTQTLRQTIERERQLRQRTEAQVRAIQQQYHVLRRGIERAWGKAGEAFHDLGAIKHEATIRTKKWKERQNAV